MAASLPTGTVTFLFTDIEGSTKLLQRLGDDYARVLGEHQTLLRATWAAYGGAEIDTAGDGFFVAFASAPEAVAAAADATRALAAHPWPEGTTLQVRMGLHTGTPQVVGDHYVGLDVHRAARIAAAGNGGQVLLSESTRVLVSHDLPEGTTLRDLGTFRLKDLQYPERLAQLVLPDLPADFPPLRTLDRHTHNLPIQPTLLLGRKEHLATLGSLLRGSEVRLITLTGAGGIGKTRLAVQAAAEALDDFPDGVWFVRLSQLTDPNLVVPTIAQTLGLKETLGQPVAQTLQDHLREHHLLLVLDNFEQVVAAAPEVGELLAHCSGLTVLVTSRVPLRVRGERDYTLVPLSLPDPSHLPPPERLTQYAAVALFVERASAARSNFTVTAANAPAIAEICARLDGLPLAIELAAARVKLLPPEALLVRLSSRLQVLTGGARDLEERQHTMRATIAWSEALLRPQERLLFRRLAIFVGGGTLEAVEVVGVAPEGGDQLGIDLLDDLEALVDQHLVQQQEEDGAARFSMLHVIREYALEQLLASGEGESVGAAHATHYLQVAEQTKPLLDGPHQVSAKSQLEREHDNLRTALSWSLDHGATEMAARFALAMTDFWLMNGHWNEQRQWVARVLQADAALPPRLRAQLLHKSGHIARMQGDYVTATNQLSESLHLFRSIDETPGTGNVLTQLAAVAMRQYHYEQAEQFIAEGLVLLQEVGDRPGVIGLLEQQGYLAEIRGDFATAKGAYGQAYVLAQSVGNLHVAANFTSGLGELALLQGEYDTAQELLWKALKAQQQVSCKNCSAYTLRRLAIAAVERGDLTEAQRLLEQSKALVEEMGRQPDLADTFVWMGVAQGAAGNTQEAEAAYQASYRIAGRLGNWQIIAACLEGLAEVALASGQSERAAQLLGAAAQALQSVGVFPMQLPPRLAAQREQVRVNARQALGEATWSVAFAAGQARSLDEVMAE